MTTAPPNFATCLRYDTERNEPYLQLPSFPDLRLTPFRPDLEDELVNLFNHPVIGERLYRLPYPFPRSFAETWVKDDVAAHQALLKDFTSQVTTASGSTSFPFSADTPLVPSHPNVRIQGMPFKSLRSVSLNRVIGDINLSLDQDEDHPGPVDPKDQSWDFGYVLDPAFHGKGISTEMVAVIIDSWIKPFMGVGTLGAYAEFNNPGSIGVLRKNGFTLDFRQTTQWPEDKGGGTRETGKFVRKLQYEGA